MSQKIINKRSSVITEDGKPKLPSSDTIDYGEIAINYADGVETLSIKNSANEIIEFKSKEYYEDIELVTSTALNDLNARMIDVETNKASSTHDHDDKYLTSEQVQAMIDAAIAAAMGNSGVTLPNEYLKITCEWGIAYLNVDDRDNIYWITYGNINGIELDGRNLYLTEASGDTTIEFEANVGGFSIDGETIEPNSVKSLTSNPTFNIDLSGLYNVAKIQIGGL